MPREQDLLEAARLGNIPVIDKLLAPKSKRSPVSLQALASLRRGTSPNCQDNTGYTPLHHAALNGHREVVALLLNYGASANLADSKGSYPLHLAAWTGNADIVRTLILHGPSHAKVNERNKDSETALHFAAQYGHTAVVKVLLEHHADPTMRNKREESPLDLACLYGRLDTVELLLRKHPHLLDRQGGQSTPLHLASRNGHRPVVQVLLEAGININQRTENGSALHEAALCGKVDIVRLLLDCGIDPLIQDKSGQTVLELLAGIPKASEITKLIKDHMNKLCLPIGSLDSTHESVIDSSPEHVQSPYDNVPLPLPSPYHNPGEDDDIPAPPPPRTLSSSDDENLYDEPPLEAYRGKEEKEADNRSSMSSGGSAYELLSEATSGQPRRSLVFKFDQSPISESAQTPLSPTGYNQPPTPDHPPPSANTAENTIHNRFFPVPSASGDSGTVPAADRHKDVSTEGSYEQTEVSESRHKNSAAVDSSATPVTEVSDANDLVEATQLDRHESNNTKDSLAPPEVSPVWKRLSQEEANQKLKETLAKKQAQKAADSHEKMSDGDLEIEKLEEEKVKLNLTVENSSLTEIPEEVQTNQSSPNEAFPTSGLTPQDLSSASSSTSYEIVPGQQWDSASETASSRSGSRSETAENLSDLPKESENPDSITQEGKNTVSLQITRVGSNAESDRSEVEVHDKGHRLSEGELQDTTLTDLTSVTSMDSLSSPAEDVAMETVTEEHAGKTVSNSVHMEKTMVVEYRHDSAEIVRRRGAGATEGEISPASTEQLLQDLQPFAALCHGSNPKTQSRVSSILYESVLKQEMENEGTESELTSTEDPDSASSASDASPFPSPSPSTRSMPDFDAIITETAELSVDRNGTRERRVNSRVEQAVDETEEWEQIATIMSSFGGGLVRESVYTAKLEGTFQQLMRGTSHPNTVGEWLQQMDLQQYENVFVSHGFDNLKFMGGNILEDQDLVEMGVADPAHRETIVAATQSLPTLLPLGEGEDHSPIPESIEEWLESLELPEYGEYFIKHGVMSMDRVRKMWEVELNVLEITTLGHRKRILASIGERERDEMPEEVSPEETAVWSTSPLSKSATESFPSPEPSPIEEVDLFKDYTNVKSKYQPAVPPRPTSVASPRLPSPRPPIPPKPARKQVPLPAEDPELVLRAPNEATTTAPIRSWRHPPDVLIKGHCNYMAHYLGSMLVTDVRGTVSTRQACAKMKKSTEQMQKVPSIILSISYKGVKFIDAKSKMMVSEHEIRNISCAAQDANDLHVFAYITKDMKTGKHYCHVFSVNSQDLGYEIILTLGQAFEIAFQMIQREKAKRSALAMERQLSSGSDRSAKWSTSSQGSQSSITMMSEVPPEFAGLNMSKS